MNTDSEERGRMLEDVRELPLRQILRLQVLYFQCGNFGFEFTGSLNEPSLSTLIVKEKYLE